MVKRYQISVCEIDLKELVESLQRIESRLSELESRILNLKLEKSPMEELLTRQEVASYFRVNISTVRNWTIQGILKKYGVGDRVYYKRSEIELILTQINGIG